VRTAELELGFYYIISDRIDFDDLDARLIADDLFSVL
jgi:hypothetical protein